MINLINNTMNAGTQGIARAQDMKAMAEKSVAAAQRDTVQLSQGGTEEPLMTPNEMKMLNKIKKHEFIKSFVSCDEDKAIYAGSLGVTGGMGAGAIGGAMTNSLSVGGGALCGITCIDLGCLERRQWKRELRSCPG
ncbi:MAG: hypothetical protein AB9903_30335 [Vulcanimicrobiota bacterium]